VLGDAAGLFLADVGLADGVQQSGLAVVDVTHDRDHRRPGFEVFLAAFVLAVGQVERLEQLAVLILGRHDLHDIVHLAAEQLEGLIADRLRRGHHLAEVEQRLYQRCRVGVDLLGEVGQRRAAGQPDGLAVAVRQPHATDDRRLHVLVFGAFRPLRLATTLGRAAGTTEGTCGSTTLTGASAATATTGATAIAAAGTRRGTATTAAGATSATAAIVTAATATAGATTGACAGTTTTGSGTGAAGSGTRPAGTTTWSRTSSTRTRRHIARRHPGPRRTRTGCLWTRNRPLNRLCRGERIVADAGGTRGGLRSTRRRTWPWPRGCAGGGSRARGGGRRRRGRCRRRGRRDRRLHGCHWRRGRRRHCGLGCRLRGSGLGRGHLGRRTVALGLRLLRGGLGAAEGFAQPARDGCLDCRGGGFDEFALFAQPGENFLAGDTEFLSQLVYTGLTCHYISISRGVSGGRRRASG
jgi:hypothetical protein